MLSKETQAYGKILFIIKSRTLGLITRRQIGFETSIVLLVLRQSLEDFDSNPTQLTPEKFITDTEIKDELELFLQEGYNKMKFQQKLNKYISNAVELGFFKEKITLDILQDFKTKLQEYVKSV